VDERRWRDIRISYDNGSTEYIARETIDSIQKIVPILESLNQAKSLRDQLNRLLGTEKEVQ